MYGGVDGRGREEGGMIGQTGDQGQGRTEEEVVKERKT